MRELHRRRRQRVGGRVLLDRFEVAASLFGAVLELVLLPMQTVDFTATLSVIHPEYTHRVRDFTSTTPRKTLGIVRPVISPDGSQIAFAAVGDIYVMPVSGGAPVNLTKDVALDTDPSWSPDERRIAVEKAREAGKPEAMLDKIAEGTVQKYLREVTLLGQVFVKAEDGKQTIEQLLKSKGASVGSFVLYVVGEGIERKQTDFAAEVAAMATARV